MRVLLIEDDLKIASFVSKGLREAGFSVDHAPDGEDGLHLALNEPYDAAIIDIMLPKLDGLTIIEELRRKKISTPVIILSARRSVDERVEGLKTGGDDYLVKPFAFAELLARVQALIRRATIPTATSVLEVDDLTLDLHTRRVCRGGKEVLLQPLEFSLLEYLMRNKGRVVSKTMIMEHVWDYDFNPQTNVVDVLVHRLRSKMDRERAMIHTIRGVGYVLRPV